MHYRICVRGRLDSAWAEWFDGLSVTADAEDNTILAGTLADQAALHGVLAKVRDLGLTLLSVTGPESRPDRAGASARDAR
jgi:hypothetical protein